MVVAIALALLVAGLAVTLIFEDHIRARATAEIGDDLTALVGNARIGADGRLAIDVSLSDRRFQAPLSGFYWQAGRGDAIDLVSPSLGQFRIAWRSRPPSNDDPALYERPGPEGRSLLVLERRVNVPGGSAEGARIVVALDQSELDEARRSFALSAAASLAALGLALVVALWFASKVSLAPFAGLRQSLNLVHRGERDALEGDFPDEIQPLVDDLNALLSARSADLVAARSRAGDLAHGLKTPLAVLGSTARRLRESGRADLADEIDGEISRMSRHVMRELMRARAGVTALRRGQRTALAPAVASLVRTMQTVSGGKAVSYAIDVPAALNVALDDTDLMEVLGNVLDNARKWATASVAVTARPAAGGVALTVEDDGPGLPASELAFRIERGRRLDEQVEGSGFGLAIVQDLVGAYGGEASLSRSPLGGLKVELLLP
jgi:signal transduction histidine kinase